MIPTLKYYCRNIATASLIILTPLLLLSACDPDSNKELHKPVNETSKLVIKKASTELKPSETKNLADEAKPAMEKQTSETIETIDSTPKQPNSDNATDKLVRELGFAEAQSSITEEETKPQYCLNKPVEDLSSTITINEICKKISDRLASVSMQGCLDSKLKKNGCESVKGFPIVARDFKPLEGTPPQGKILVIGGTHADELTSISTVFKWIEKLNAHHSGLFHWHVAPLMNPDGLFRKSATRTNHNGVDLNRNMPSDDWHSHAHTYWHTKGGKSPRKYPGESPSSEPETQWLIDEINSFQPDAIISVHAPYGIVDFDALLLKNAPRSLGQLHLNLLGTYPGSLGNYAGINRNIPVITVELPHAWEMPSDKEVGKIWEDIVGWLKANIDTRPQSNKIKQ